MIHFSPPVQQALSFALMFLSVFVPAMPSTRAQLDRTTRVTTLIRRIVLGFGVAALLLMLAEPAAAQCRSTKRPGWLQRSLGVGVGESIRDSLHLTAAEKAVVCARLEKVEDLFYRIAELAPPQGFTVMPICMSNIQIGGRVIDYVWTLLFRPGNNTSGDAWASIEVTFNQSAHGINTEGGGTLKDEQGREIFNEARRFDPFPGATLVYGRSFGQRGSGLVNIVFTRDGMSPWLPVTREELYKAHLFNLEGKNGEKIAATRKAFAKTPYEQWLAQAAERKKTREQMLAMASIGGPEMVAKMRKSFEDADRKMETQLKANDAKDRALLDSGLANQSALQNKMRAELDAMTIAERQLPAIIDLTGPIAASGIPSLTSTENENTRRVLTPNPDFWRPRNSRIEVRAVSVFFDLHEHPQMANAIWQTFRKLDWDAIRALVAAPN